MCVLRYIRQDSGDAVIGSEEAAVQQMYNLADGVGAAEELRRYFLCDHRRQCRRLQGTAHDVKLEYVYDYKGSLVGASDADADGSHNNVSCVRVIMPLACAGLPLLRAA